MLTSILCAIAIIAKRLPLINSIFWWIRIFDFPKIQIAVLTLFTIILAYVYLDFNWKFKIVLLLILVFSIVYQVQFVVVYTLLYKTQTKESNKPIAENSFNIPYRELHLN